MKDCPNWLLHYSLFILLSSLSPLGISQMSFMWDLPLGCERLLFLNDGRWLGCRAEELGQLTRPRGESLQVSGSHGNRTLTPEGGRTWEYSAVWFRSLKYTWGIIGNCSRPPLHCQVCRFHCFSLCSICKFSILKRIFFFFFWAGIINYFHFHKIWKSPCGRDFE